MCAWRLIVVRFLTSAADPRVHALIARIRLLEALAAEEAVEAVASFRRVRINSDGAARADQKPFKDR
jgi:hypothetical protein